MKQLPFYGRIIEPRIKEFTNAKLLCELPFFEKPIKAKIKQLTTKKLLQEQPFYKQSIKKPRIKKLKNYELLLELPFYDDINISRKESDCMFLSCHVRVSEWIHIQSFAKFG